MAVRVSRLKYGQEEYLVLSYPLHRPRAFAELTRAEIDVAEGLLGGLTMRTLARRRGVTERTIANQTLRIYRKLGVTSRHELVAMVSRPKSAGRT
jgi:DNA-binding NarL/FixJ family response regulator